MEKYELDQVLNRLYGPINHASKWQRVSALGSAALAAKDTKAGHRVYLRCMSMLEIELGVANPSNAEVQEGFLDSVEGLVSHPDELDEDMDDEDELLME